MQFMICCGGSLAFVLGTFIAWRTLAIAGKLFCLAVCKIVCLGVPVYKIPLIKMRILVHCMEKLYGANLVNLYSSKSICLKICSWNYPVCILLYA
jgi:hypothetical protein